MSADQIELTPDASDPAVAVQKEDLAALAQIRAGKTELWSVIFSRHQQRLFAICYRMVRDRDLAEDLVQDAVVKIIKGIDSYDNRARLSTWMTRVAINVVLTRMRSEKYRKHASLDAGRSGSASSDTGGRSDYSASASRAGSRSAHVRRPDGTDAPLLEPDPGSAVESRELLDRLADALATVTDEQRAILLLRDAHDLEYEHIAHVLNVPVGTVKSRLFRARQALRRAMQTTGTEHPPAHSEQSDALDEE